MNNIKTWDSRWENEFIKVDLFLVLTNDFIFVVIDKILLLRSSILISVHV